MKSYICIGFSTQFSPDELTWRWQCIAFSNMILAWCRMACKKINTVNHFNCKFNSSILADNPFPWHLYSTLKILLWTRHLSCRDIYVIQTKYPITDYYCLFNLFTSLSYPKISFLFQNFRTNMVILYQPIIFLITSITNLPTQLNQTGRKFHLTAYFYYFWADSIF